MAIESELRTQGLIASCLTAGQASGVFRPLDPDMTASLIKPLLQDWYLKRWKYRGNKVMPDDYAAWVIRFVEAFVDRVRATTTACARRGGCRREPTPSTRRSREPYKAVGCSLRWAESCNARGASVR